MERRAETLRAARRLSLVLNQPCLAPVPRARLASAAALSPSASPFVVTEVDGCGLGVVATRAIPAESLVYVDVALETLQHGLSRSLIRACCFCLSPVGPPAEQLSQFFAALPPDRQRAVGESLSASAVEALRHPQACSRESLLREAAQFLASQAQLLSTQATPDCVSPPEASAASRQLALTRFLAERIQRLSAAPFATAVECAFGCGEKFCSEECLADDVAHALLCVGPLEESHPLVAFKRFALESHENLLLSAKLFCSALAAAAAQVGEGGESASLVALAEALLDALIGSHAGGRWEEMAEDDDEASQEEEQEEERKGASRASVVERGAALLQAALASHSEAFARLATPERLSRVLGLFERNNCNAAFDSPLNKFFGGCKLREEFRTLLIEKELLLDALFGGVSEDDEEEDEMEEATSSPQQREASLRARFSRAPLEELQPANPEDSPESAAAKGKGSSFPSVQGSAFFPSVARLNHSCAPNVRVATLGPLCLLRTSRDVRAGEELTMSYCDFSPNETFEERAARLAEFGFSCRCLKCAAEKPSLRLTGS